MDAGDDQTGMRDHMDAGDAWNNLCKLKTLCENGWVPQKCGAYEIIEKGATSATMWHQVWHYVWHYLTEVGCGRADQ
jgi:hypothetical protein